FPGHRQHRREREGNDLGDAQAAGRLDADAGDDLAVVVDRDGVELGGATLVAVGFDEGGGGLGVGNEDDGGQVAGLEQRIDGALDLGRVLFVSAGGDQFEVALGDGFLHR